MSAFTRLRLLVLPAITAGLVVTTLGSGPAEAADRTTRHEKISHAQRIAARQIGDPYRYGAAGPGRFDCSGLIYYSYRKAGLDVPRTSSQQARSARHIRKSQLRRGDLMFFRGRNGVYHDAIFLRWSRTNGRALMLHSPSPGKKVRREVTWTNQWYGGTLRRR